MAASISRPVEIIQHELQRLRKEWYWFVALGILLIIAGVIAIGHSYMVSEVAVKLLGFLLLIGGSAQLVSSFWAGRWSGFLLSMLAGVLYIVVGGIMIGRTEPSIAALTLLMGAFFLVGGIYRIAAAMALRMHHWGWLLLNGVITALLGLLVLSEVSAEPLQSLRLIGLFIGIDMLFNGWFWVMLGFSVRTLPEEPKAIA